MTRHTYRTERHHAARVPRWLALLVVVVGGIAVPAKGYAVSSSTQPASFVTYPISDGSPEDFQLGPDGRWWITPFSGTTIDRVSTAGVDSPLQWGSSTLLSHITAGSDGNLWMTDFSIGSGGGIDKISPSGILLATYSDSDFPYDVVLGSDGNVWYTGNQDIGRITPSGVITQFPWPGESSGRIINGPDGNLWVISEDQNQVPVIGRITTGGVITSFPAPELGGHHVPQSIAAGPDGNVWYADGIEGTIARMTPSGVVTLYATPESVDASEIAAGPDGSLWFTASGNQVGRITTSGQIGVFDAGIGTGRIGAGPDGRIWLTAGPPSSVAAFQPFAPAASAPQIRDISTRYSLPSGGGQVTLTGYDVGAATNVLFGSTPATSFTALGPSQLVVTVPPHPVGAVDVTVDTPFGTSVPIAPTGAYVGSHFYYQATNCGTVITHSTHLSGDIGPCYIGGVTVAADNITLDLGGHGVVGFQDPRDGTVVGINLPQRSGVSIVNGTVSGFDAGIHIGGGSGNTVANMSIYDNIGPDNLPQFGDGIMIEHGSSNNQIVHNIINNNGTYDGIGIYDPASDGNSIVNNVVENTVGPAGHAPAGEGIIINGTSGTGASTAIHGASVVNNIVRNNASGGIANINEIGGSIQNNQVTGNGTTNSFGNGIGVQVGRLWNLGPTKMLIQDNDVRGNGVDGIRLGTLRPPFNGSVQGNIVSDNVSVDNGTNLSVDTAETFRGPIQAYDLHDLDPTCGTNVWTGNQWGSAGFSPACTSTGGSQVASTTPSGAAPRAAAPNGAASSGADPSSTLPDEQAWDNFLEQGRP